jgi:hypothetical protein
MSGALRGDVVAMMGGTETYCQWHNSAILMPNYARKPGDTQSLIHSCQAFTLPSAGHLYHYEGGCSNSPALQLVVVVLSAKL